MTKMIMLVGISGAGKSTYAKKYISQHPEFEYVSSDAMRKEINGSEEDQSNPELVFTRVQQQVRECLKSGQSVIYDATNMSRKSRRSLMSAIRSVPNVEKECHVILAPFGFACQNQGKRTRHVDFEILKRHMASFKMPEELEGFSKIIYHNEYDYHRSKDDIIERLDGFDQHGKWHVEDVGTHCRLVNKAAADLNASWAVREAAAYHDIGKYYTASEDDKGMHFYNHGNVSTYLYLCDHVIGEQISPEELRVARLIQDHDTVYRRGFSSEYYAATYGQDMLDDLMMLRRADMAGMISEERYHEMSLDEFLNTFQDWQSRLHDKPFCVYSKQESPYVLFKYNQFDTDMSYRVSQECRGSIYKQLEDGSFECVCRPFDKFFNYGQAEAAEIDWSCARVSQKIDGSLHKVWFDDGAWHLSTNGMINAYDACAGDSQTSFGMIFERVLGANVEELGKHLDPSRTYMFELTSPETQIVIPYQDGLYYLASRDTKTGKECFDRPDFGDFPIQFPKEYKLSSIKDTVAVVDMMKKDEEGVVVNDLHGNRLKIKSPEYLAEAKIVMKVHLNDRRLYEYIRDEKIDDFLAYVPEQREDVEKIQAKIQDFCRLADAAWSRIRPEDYADRKAFALAHKDDPFKGYYFVKIDRPETSASDYFFHLTEPIALRWLGIKKDGDRRERPLPDISSIQCEDGQQNLLEIV